ncbi:stage III sporulation protein SpoIIIAB [Clostridium malenominatum]|uniref:Stage III sporulation protein SpoIIIAB n=1 Tax=Clostridium malenominatum TaxID=1539 RepID=A0ABP3U3R1_9CLOT
MLKIIGSLMVVVSTTWIGFFYSSNLNKRNNQLKEFQRCIYQLQNEIIYTYTPLPEVFLSISKKSKVPMDKFFNELSRILYSNEVDSVYEGIKKAYEGMEDILNFNKEDLNLIYNLGKGLGETDIEGQKKVVALTLDNLKSQLIEAETLVKKNVKMYRFLGFTIGMMVVIIFI